MRSQPLPAKVPPAQADRPEGRFDLQAHRGGTGLYTESTLASFSNALKLGVTTLELDTQVTEDGAVVVTHDRRISGTKCRDTAPATPNDPEFPYLGKYLTNLTLEQVQTVECGYKQLPQFPDQQISTGPMIELSDVFALIKQYRANKVMAARGHGRARAEASAPVQRARSAEDLNRLGCPWSTIRCTYQEMEVPGAHADILAVASQLQGNPRRRHQ